MMDLTVIIMTYNHVNYIKKAIDSILEQKTQVQFNIFIHDDCSSDGTYEILLDYQKEHPDKITIIHQDFRKFPVYGFNMMICNFVVPHINSKYIAYCDGDDYWCDPLKLQKQFDYMECHPECSMCFHSAYQLRGNSDLSSKWFIAEDGDIGMPDLINDRPGICVATSSIFLKSEVFKNFSNWRKAYPVEDLPMYMTAAMEGKIHRLQDIMCVYRQFSTGSWSQQNQKNTDRLISHQKDLKKAAILFDKETDHKYHDLVISHVEGCDFRIALLTKDYKIIFQPKNKRFIKRMPFKERLSLKLQYKAPHLYNFLKRKK